ncbi:MAG: asparagine synthase (glutamine-hydrolyzing) [Spirochaetota bacterium]|nr:asparagine synthase (glutamine-hydrolyzing) [Spirochaetota bacterium]
MCGIVGFTCYNSNIDKENVIKKMADAIRHRGPDDEGFYFTSQMVLGHRRLSIIDLGSGHQPIFNEDKSVSIVFNGEIYNFLELKESLIKKGHKFKTNSDTEVIVHLYEDHQENLLTYLNGMFSFALWDQNHETLFLARDRAGKKPLYYTEINGELIFASELKAILRYPYFRKEIDDISLYKYLAHEYIPTPQSIFKGVKKLPAGSYLIYKRGSLSISSFWDLHFNGAYQNTLSEGEIVNNLDTLLRDSVKRRLISDVPLGVFLSGGIDSSAIVSYMADLIPSKEIKTFSIGFEDKSFDESNFARDVAKHFNTDHYERILNPKMLVDILPEVINFLDEPFADASIIPTYLLSKFTREKVTVALGGDGGDELFMGYPTFQANRISGLYDWMPNTIHKNIIVKLVNKIPVSMNNISFDFKVKRFLYGVKADKNYREQLWLGAFSFENIEKLIKSNKIHELNEEKLFDEVIFFNQNNDTENQLDRLSYYYFKTYLHDDILVKVDRASMACSLETRAPFLDVQVMDFVGCIPNKYKLKGLSMKYILKKILAGRLPNHILHRPKKGFGIPVAKWFKDDLKALVLDVFSEEKIKREGFFHYPFIKTLLNEHFSEKQDHRKMLWTLFIFELWLEKWGL